MSMNNFINKEFMIFFGVIYLVTTTFVLLFKKENDDPVIVSEENSLIESYKVVWKIASLKPIRKLAFLLFTIRVTIFCCLKFFQLSKY